VPVAVTGHRQRVDREDGDSGGAQARDQQALGGLNRDRDRRLAAATVRGQQRQQLGEPGHVVTDPYPGAHLPGFVDDGDVVVSLGPVDPAPQLHPFLLSLGWRWSYPDHRGGAGDERAAP